MAPLAFATKTPSFMGTVVSTANTIIRMLSGGKRGTKSSMSAVPEKSNNEDSKQRRKSLILPSPDFSFNHEKEMESVDCMRISDTPTKSDEPSTLASSTKLAVSKIKGTVEPTITSSSISTREMRMANNTVTIHSPPEPSQNQLSTSSPDKVEEDLWDSEWPFPEIDLLDSSDSFVSAVDTGLEHGSTTSKGTGSPKPEMEASLLEPTPSNERNMTFVEKVKRQSNNRLHPYSTAKSTGKSKSNSVVTKLTAVETAVTVMTTTEKSVNRRPGGRTRSGKIKGASSTSRPPQESLDLMEVPSKLPNDNDRPIPQQTVLQSGLKCNEFRSNQTNLVTTSLGLTKNLGTPEMSGLSPTTVANNNNDAIKEHQRVVGTMLRSPPHQVDPVNLVDSIQVLMSEQITPLLTTSKVTSVELSGSAAPTPVALDTSNFPEVTKTLHDPLDEDMDMTQPPLPSSSNEKDEVNRRPRLTRKQRWLEQVALAKAIEDPELQLQELYKIQLEKHERSHKANVKRREKKRKRLLATKLSPLPPPLQRMKDALSANPTGGSQPSRTPSSSALPPPQRQQLSATPAALLASGMDLATMSASSLAEVARWLAERAAEKKVEEAQRRKENRIKAEQLRLIREEEAETQARLDLLRAKITTLVKSDDRDKSDDHARRTERRRQMLQLGNTSSGGSGSWAEVAALPPTECASVSLQKPNPSNNGSGFGSKPPRFNPYNDELKYVLFIIEERSRQFPSSAMAKVIERSLKTKVRQIKAKKSSQPPRNNPEPVWMPRFTLVEESSTTQIRCGDVASARWVKEQIPRVKEAPGLTALGRQELDRKKVYRVDYPDKIDPQMLLRQVAIQNHGFYRSRPEVHMEPVSRVQRRTVGGNRSHTRFLAVCSKVASVALAKCNLAPKVFQSKAKFYPYPSLLAVSGNEPMRRQRKAMNNPLTVFTAKEPTLLGGPLKKQLRKIRDVLPSDNDGKYSDKVARLESDLKVFHAKLYDLYKEISCKGLIHNHGKIQ